MILFGKKNISDVTSSTNNSATKQDNAQQLMDKLSDCVDSLFSNHDWKPLLRICRTYVKGRPEILHNAISHNYLDLLTKFIPIVPIDLLQMKNESDETILHHAVRLNHVDIVELLLEKKDVDRLLENLNGKQQNVFHIIAMNANSEETLKLLIDHMLKKSINISEKFDHVDHDNHTPLQLSIINNNIAATRHLVKYFDKMVCETNDDTGDNLIHLTVRYSDLTMLKYLLEDNVLIEQGNQSNLTMKPIELARLMTRNDLVEFLNEKYGQSEIDKYESSDDDDDDDET